MNDDLNVLCCRAPRDHGNTDGVDPDSCDDVHVSDVLVSPNACFCIVVAFDFTQV